MSNLGGVFQFQGTTASSYGPAQGLSRHFTARQFRDRPNRSPTATGRRFRRPRSSHAAPQALQSQHAHQDSALTHVPSDTELREASFEAADLEDDDEPDGGVRLPAGTVDGDLIAPEASLEIPLIASSDQAYIAQDYPELAHPTDHRPLSGQDTTVMPSRFLFSRPSSRRNSTQNGRISSPPAEDVTPAVAVRSPNRLSFTPPSPQETSVLPRTNSQTMFEMVGNQPFLNDYSSIHDVCNFLTRWRLVYVHNEGNDVIDPVSAEAEAPWALHRPTRIDYKDIRGDRRDMQGINWEKLGTTRAKARTARQTFYHFGQLAPRSSPSTRGMLSKRTYFNFRRMNTVARPWLAHYQLRNLACATSRSDVYYLEKSCKIMHYDPSTQNVSCALNLATGPRAILPPNIPITCMSAIDDFLVAGRSYGGYAMINLASAYGTPASEGFVCEGEDYLNHVEAYKGRSAHPHAAFSSNNGTMRVLDCYTNQFIYEFEYPEPVNCSAISPNGRLRAVVGDFKGTFVTDAQTGQTLKHIYGHGPNVDAFACAWADDGIHVATAANDSRVLVYDARRWDYPLADISCEMADVRALRFSPVGGGKRVLIAAEAADIVSVIDARTWERKQSIDFFGNIAGVAVAPDGSEFFVANSDPKFGGIMEFKRANSTDDDHRHSKRGSNRREDNKKTGARSGRARHSDDGDCVGRTVSEASTPTKDWLPEYELEHDPRVVRTAKARRRAEFELDDVLV